MGFHLKDFTPFEWNKVVVITPYTMKLDVVNKVGLDGSVLACSRNDLSDEWTQLIFQLDGKIVSYFDISSYLLSQMEQKEYMIEDARLSVSCLGAGLPINSENE